LVARFDVFLAAEARLAVLFLVPRAAVLRAPVVLRAAVLRAAVLRAPVVFLVALRVAFLADFEAFLVVRLAVPAAFLVPLRAAEARLVAVFLAALRVDLVAFRAVDAAFRVFLTPEAAFLVVFRADVAAFLTLLVVRLDGVLDAFFAGMVLAASR